MTDETEQKILDAALKLFSKEGYKAATTMAIAEEAGFSEKTLFRKFKSKRNLYDMVVTQNVEKIKEDFSSMLRNYEFEDHKDFLRAFIKDLMGICEDNFEIIHVALEDVSESSEPLMGEWVNLLSETIEKNIPGKGMDYPIFTMTILSFIYTLAGDIRRGRTFIDLDDALEKFIDNMSLCIQ